MINPRNVSATTLTASPTASNAFFNADPTAERISSNALRAAGDERSSRASPPPSAAMDAVANPIGLVIDAAAMRSSPITSTAPFAATIDPRPAPTPSRPVLTTAHTPVPLDRLETRSDMKNAARLAAGSSLRPIEIATVSIDDCNASNAPFHPAFFAAASCAAAPPFITSSRKLTRSSSFNDLSTAAARDASVPKIFEM